MVIGEDVRPLVNAPEFPLNIQWLNTSEPSSIKKLKGRYVLLDFWTYACINCMHVVPDLERLELEFGSQLTVIGVHSAKFQNEKNSKQITKAIERFGIHHPVVNDSEFEVWQSYGVKAWPTVVLIDPNGKILLTRSGEGVYDALQPILNKLIKRDSDGPVTKKINLVPSEQLRFPGKVIVEKDRIFISDSGRNRIVVTTLNGEILEIIGGDESGHIDGSFSQTRFNEPLGLALKGEKLYVADRKNHLIRVCNLLTKTCEVLVGSSKQGKIFNLSGRAKEVDLNSPWDLFLDGDSLYVAMAGFHQIWKVDLATKFAEPFSGTGAEAITDGPIKNLDTGGTHAQPSGISGANGVLFVADSESSSIREIYKNQLTTLIGSGLFDFGDRDGDCRSAKLQHPLGVLWSEDRLFIADTFNSKIKVITLPTKKIETLSGGSSTGFKDGTEALFDEPSGLAILDNQLYVADTNNSAIRVINLSSKEVRTLKLFTNSDGRKNFGEVKASLSPETGKIRLIFKLPGGHSFNTEAPSQLRNEKQEIFKIVSPGSVLVPVGSYEGEIYFCHDSTKLCLLERFKFLLQAQPGHDFQIELAIGAEKK